MKRSEIEERFKWDLSKFCASDADLESKMNKIEPLANKLKAFKGKLSDKEKLLEFLNLDNKCEEIYSDVGIYLYSKKDSDLANTKYIELNNIYNAKMSKIGAELSFVAPELLKQPKEFFDDILSDKRFKNNHFYFKNLLRNKPHCLSENEEKLLAKTHLFSGEFSEIFDAIDDVDLKFKKAVDASGKEYELTNASYGKHIESKDRVLRKSAFKNLYEGYMALKNTIATNLIASIKADFCYADIRSYKGVFEAARFSDKIKDVVYENLVKNVHSNFPLLHKYYEIKAKALKLKDFSYYDMAVSISKNPEKKFEYDEACNILINTFSVLGDDYVNLIKRSIKERWIDVFPCENKASGGYCNHIYGKTPIVLLNFVGTMDDVFTFAHETGHAMHSYYSSENQPRELASYTIFLAEIASTVNEVILLKSLYSKCEDKQEKIYLLDKYLKMFKSTLLRQTMFSETEEFMHGLVQKGEGISLEKISNFYGDLNKKYHGKALVHAEEINYEFLRIPHFYRPFYVYKYATGIVSAISIAFRILSGESGMLNKYKAFLKSGGNGYSVEILKKAGVNLETNEPYNIAFAEMKWALDELEKLLSGK